MLIFIVVTLSVLIIFLFSDTRSIFTYTRVRKFNLLCLRILPVELRKICFRITHYIYIESNNFVFIAFLIYSSCLVLWSFGVMFGICMHFSEFLNYFWLFLLYVVCIIPKILIQITRMHYMLKMNGFGDFNPGEIQTPEVNKPIEFPERQRDETLPPNASKPRINIPPKEPKTGITQSWRTTLSEKATLYSRHFTTTKVAIGCTVFGICSTLYCAFLQYESNQLAKGKILLEHIESQRKLGIITDTQASYLTKEVEKDYGIPSSLEKYKTRPEFTEIALEDRKALYKDATKFPKNTEN